MDRAGLGARVRCGHRGPRACRRGAPDPRPRRRRPGAMAATGAPHQSDARYIGPWRGGHDLTR